MAKESSAERVSPITRANYTGNPNGAGHEAGYDPLAALASLVGSIESDAAEVGNQATEKSAFDLESELVKDFHSAENAVPHQSVDYNEMENELSFALEAGVPDEVEPVHDLHEVLSAAEEKRTYDEPVMQSLASLHTAFGVQPQPEAETAAEPVDLDFTQPASPMSDEAMIESQLLRELNLEQPQQSPVAELPNNVYPAAEHAAPVFEARSVTIPPVEQFQHREPAANIPAIRHPTQSEPARTVDPMDFSAEANFAAEFEAAISESTAVHTDQPAVEQAIVSEVEAVPLVNEQSFDDMPFGTLEEAVIMPPVNTPFDNQVDHALNDIIESEPPTDSALGWSGNLAGELENIVASSTSAAATVATPVAVAPEPITPNAPETAGFDGFVETQPPVATAPFVDDIAPSHAEVSPAAVDTRIVNQALNDPTDFTDFTDFEKELADQLNPEIGNNSLFDDPLVGIPDAPEYVEETKKRGGMGVAFGVLGVAAVVAAGAFSWNYFSNDGVSTSVPTILASSDPVKIKPKEPGGVKIPNQDQVVYEQVNGNTTENTSQERLASGAEIPIRVVTADATPPVVQPLPVGGSDSSAAKSSARVSASDTVFVRSEQVIVSPRKVRTVIVRPDGTIVAVKPGASTGVKARKVKPIRVASTAKIDNFVEPLAKSTMGTIAKSTPPVVAPLSVDSSSGAAESIVPIRKIDVAPVKPIGNGTAKLRTATTPIAVVKTKPVAIVAPQKVKVRPIKKVAAPKKIKAVSKPVKIATASTGGYVMQISSQRSAEAAQSSYNRLSRRFSGILGGKGVDIRRFKLKGKGIYYRVRIPAGSKRSAINLCTRYKSAGGSCFVTR